MCLIPHLQSAVTVLPPISIVIVACFHNIITNSISNIFQSQQGKFVIPGGLKIFWGEGQTSASPDDSSVYPATVSFPEPFSNTNYLFICQRWVSYAHTYKENNVYAYLGNDVQAAYAGSPRPNQPFRWIAIGY